MGDKAVRMSPENSSCERDLRQKVTFGGRQNLSQLGLQNKMPQIRWFQQLTLFLGFKGQDASGFGVWDRHAAWVVAVYSRS